MLRSRRCRPRTKGNNRAAAGQVAGASWAGQRGVAGHRCAGGRAKVDVERGAAAQRHCPAASQASSSRNGKTAIHQVAVGNGATGDIAASDRAGGNLSASDCPSGNRTDASAIYGDVARERCVDPVCTVIYKNVPAG